MIYHDEILSEAPTVYLPHEEVSGTDIDDLSGGGRDGTYSGTGVGYRVPGPLVDLVSYGVSLDGVAGTGTVTLTGADRPTYPLAVETWCRPASATPAEDAVAVCLLSSDGIESAAITVGTENRWSAAVINTDTPAIASIQGTVPITGEMQHLLLVAASAVDFTLYVDGITAGTNVVGAPGFAGLTDSYDLCVGYNGDGGAHLAAAFSRSALYATAPSAARAAAHYRAGVLAPLYQAVSEALKNDAATLAATAGAVFAGQFPDDHRLPGLRYALLTDTPHDRLGGGDHFTAELQVDAYADRGDENLAWAISEAARQVLRRASIRQSGYSRIASIGITRGTPVMEAGVSRVTTRYRLFGTAA